MKLPKTLNIFGEIVKVGFGKLKKTHSADYDPHKKKITIARDYVNDRELLHTLLHEAGHAMFFRVSIDQSVSYEVHEFIVNNYATMLLDNFEIKIKETRS